MATDRKWRQSFAGSHGTKHLLTNLENVMTNITQSNTYKGLRSVLNKIQCQNPLTLLWQREETGKYSLYPPKKKWTLKLNKTDRKKTIKVMWKWRKDATIWEAHTHVKLLNLTTNCGAQWCSDRTLSGHVLVLPGQGRSWAWSVPLSLSKVLTWAGMAGDAVTVVGRNDTLRG